MQHYTEKAQSYLLEVHDTIIASQINQTYQANKRRREEPAYKVGDRAWLSTEYLAMPKGQVRKLLPKFIGPFPITRVDKPIAAAQNIYYFLFTMGATFLNDPA